MAVLAFAIQAAEAADDLTTELNKCAVMTDNWGRLTCYDQLAARLKSSPSSVVQAPAAVAAPSVAQAPVASAPAAPVNIAQAPAAPPPAKEDGSWFGISQWFGGNTAPEQQKTPAQFGSEDLPAPPAAPGAAAAEPLDSITADVSDVAFGYFGRFTVFLANGQIWQQLQGDTAIAKFDKHGKNSVTISRGALGSYNLKVDGHTGLFKVKRLK